MTIRSVISEGGFTRTTDYEVPFVQVFRTIPGTVSLTNSGSTFTRNVQGLRPDGKAFEIMESGSTDGVWFSAVANTLAGESLPAANLQVSLQHVSEPVTPMAGKAIWLLPSLMEPSSGVRVLSANAIESESGPHAVTLPSYCNSTAISTLHTIDNPNPQPFGSFEVWYTQLSVCGELSNGVYASYYGQLDAVPTSPLNNWWLTAASFQWVGALTQTAATARSQAEFIGVFPTAASQIWRGYGDHQTTLTTTDHQTVLDGGIDWYDAVSGVWSVWNRQRFYDGVQKFPNDGTAQVASWFVVNCNAALICLN